MSETTETLLDLDALMNRNMVDIEEAAGFITPSEGVYYLAIAKCFLEKYKTREEPNTDKHRIKMNYAVVQCLEKSNESDPDSPKNGLFSEVFQINDTGLGYFKAKANDILGSTDGLNLGDSIRSIDTSAAVVKASVKLKKTPKVDAQGNKTNGEYINVQVKILERTEDIPFPDLPGKEKAAA